MTQTLISQQKPFEIEKPARPFPWACVTGADFGRANAWARRHPSTINAEIRSRIGLRVSAPLREPSAR